jgi:hypothetical protein
MANSIRFKRYKGYDKTYHQVFVDGQCIGSLTKEDRYWIICRWHGWGGWAESRRKAAQKLIEVKVNAQNPQNIQDPH